ncbi:cytochrome d ubiquinol oxidase subunit II [Methyloligella sp. 2.7D]|uniref:cytochrome d ubiquinol oxidase subunit II n=1 Tax=unclassified Methyloligella TaxID=2625955 RepID=UPI00157D3321|nr:cytochrome d ubiquinol oxidase subunit II [Methyloligella sp. GL2]QKP76440.1 cytochrome d ubiquinol oxidase subunit II [Methyloligella sp. GL2]
MSEYLPTILPLVWAAILVLGVFIYVLLDGFDLGIGILFPFAPNHDCRDKMMNSVAPYWDGNETWLVLGGGGLLAAFPMAYAIFLPALYLPVILMLAGLILRGVAFEFRYKADTSRWMWDAAFAGGSTLAALIQGAAVGAFIQGFDVKDGAYAGGAFDWLTPFVLVTAVALAAGYVLLACGWLIMKSDGELRDWAYKVGGYAIFAVAAFIVVFSIWTPLAHEDIAARWFHPGNLVMLSPVPVLTALAVVGVWYALKQRWTYLPFLLSILIFMLCYTGLAVSLFPFIIPPEVTIWDAAAAPESQLFMLYGAIPLVPIIVGYTIYSYYSMWHVKDHSAYH